MTNTGIWDALGKTDPAHTKGFTRAGGFRGTAIKPIYTSHKMTEQFGPCGIGWGINEPSYQLVNGPGGEVAVYCTVSIWFVQHGKRSDPVPGVGGDFCVKSTQKGMTADDEAFKKAFTDAVGNAMKQLGMSADVHMGRFDDAKYVNGLRREMAEEAAPEVAAAEPDKPTGPQPGGALELALTWPDGKRMVWDKLSDWLTNLERAMRANPAGVYQCNIALIAEVEDRANKRVYGAHSSPIKDRLDKVRAMAASAPTPAKNGAAAHA